VSEQPTTLPITWSQHWEDVRLWRVLRDRAPGFYVDVGARDPSVDSVTRIFYDLGWRGVDVEPDPHHAERMRAARPEDRIVEAAASDTPGPVTFFLIDPDEGGGAGLSTVDAQVAAQHEAAGHTVEQLTVDRVRLADVLDGTDAGSPERFHFLKIDVEGHETAVLRGCDLRRFRPLVVVFEARSPDSGADTYADGEALLVASGYMPAADDGLNRWYVREEDSDLAATLRPEINPLTDGWPRRADDQAQIDALATRVAELDGELVEAKRVRDASIAELETELQDMLGSKSWRVTAPLRSLSRALGRGRGPAT
jgi:FkbM family methyltransferase